MEVKTVPLPSILQNTVTEMASTAAVICKSPGAKWLVLRISLVPLTGSVSLASSVTRAQYGLRPAHLTKFGIIVDPDENCKPGGSS
jgi:hypothetical protein